MNISDTNVLITGGAGNIGRSLCKGMINKAHTIIAIDNDEIALKELSVEFPQIKCYHVNLTNVNEVNNVVNTIITDHGKIHVLINNAGIIHSEPLINLLSKVDAKHSIDNWHKTMDINLNAVFYITVHVAEKMVKGRTKGVIINISSISSYGNVGQSAYSASKAALNALTVTWGKELGMFGIRCNAIAPGFIDTESTMKALSETRVKAYQKATPLGRLGKTEELLSAVEFIIQNDFYNCAVLDLNGGLSL